MVPGIVEQKRAFAPNNRNRRIRLLMLGIGMPDDLLIAVTEGRERHII
jgi:hypothetical protein